MTRCVGMSKFRDMNSTAARKALTTIGAEVEVEVTDFATAGYPRVWVRATVIDATPAEKTVDVKCCRHDATDRNGNGLVHVVRIGVRAGGKGIRLAA